MKVDIFLSRILACLMVGIFFSDLCLYGFESHFLPAPVIFFSWFFALIAILSWLRPSALKAFLGSQVFLWLVFVLSISIGWFFITIQDPAFFSFMRQRIYSLTFIGSTAILLAIPEARQTARRCMILAILFGISLNIVDVIQPLTFTPFLGRSTGLYLNPNVAGTALVMGFIVSWEIVPVRWRASYYVLLLVGVIPTISRSAIIMALLLGPILCGAGLFAWKQWLLAIAIVFGLTILLVPIALNFSAHAIDGAVMQDLIMRVTFSTGDYSTGDRILVMREALTMISEAPIIGHGTGASYFWTLDRSTHNMYLNFMIDHGVWAILLLPTLFASMAKPTKLCALYIAYWSIFALFTHNILDETSFLALLAFTPYLGESC